MSSRWTKHEEEILKQYFYDADWDVFIGKLHDKTEKQIIKRVNKLGLKRLEEKSEPYYDYEKKAWVEIYTDYNSTFFRGTKITYPSPSPDISIEEVKKALAKSYQDVLTDLFIEYVNNKYGYPVVERKKLNKLY